MAIFYCSCEAYVTLFLFKKVDAGLLEKTDSMPRFTITVRNPFLINSRVFISNMTIVFSNSSSGQK